MTIRALDLVRAAAEPRHALNLLEVANSAWPGQKFRAHTYKYDGHEAPGVTYNPSFPFVFGIAVPAQGDVWIFSCGSKDPIRMKRIHLTPENIRTWVGAAVALYKAENKLQELIYEHKQEFVNRLRVHATDATELETFETKLWFDGTDFKVS
jgi:hypothetical protein